MNPDGCRRTLGKSLEYAVRAGSVSLFCALSVPKASNFLAVFMEAESGGGRASLDLEAANSQLWVCSPLMRRRATSVAKRGSHRNSAPPNGIAPVDHEIQAAAIVNRDAQCSGASHCSSGRRWATATRAHVRSRMRGSSMGVPAWLPIDIRLRFHSCGVLPHCTH